MAHALQTIILIVVDIVLFICICFSMAELFDIRNSCKVRFVRKRSWLSKFTARLFN